jgi:hypothetical protein
VIPKQGYARLNVSLPLPVTSGNLLVVAAVFGSVDGGKVSDTLSNSFSEQSENRTTQCSPCAPEASKIGTGIWWSVSKSSGNDTLIIASQKSTELVEVFEIAGANISTIGFAGGGGWASTPGLNGMGSQNIHDGDAFAMLIGGSICEVNSTSPTPGEGASECNPGNELCYPSGPIDELPAQSQGIIIEPYCGTRSLFTNGLIYGEYGVGNNTGQVVCYRSGNTTACSTVGKGFTVNLAVNPPLSGNALGQLFYVDPDYSISYQQSTTTTAVPPLSSSSYSSSTAIATRTSTQSQDVSTQSLTGISPSASPNYTLYIASGITVAVVLLATLVLLHRHEDTSENREQKS